MSSRTTAAPVPVALDAHSAWEVYVHGGRTPTGIDAVKWARYVEQRGAGEILLTSMDADGTKAGYDLALLHAVSTATTIPLIASGGAGSFAHFLEAVTTGGANAVLAATMFHFRECRIRDAKQYLQAHGVPIRVV